MDVDPAASMRLWAVDLEIGGTVYTVPPLPAADWWPVIVSGDPAGVLDLLRSEPGVLEEQLLSGEVTGEELGQVLVDTIEEVAGRSFHAAFVLAVAATHGWGVIGGELAQRGFRWDLMPLGAALDAIYLLVLTNMPDEKKRQEFVRLLDNETLTTGKKARPRAREKVVAEFENLAGPKPTAGLTSTGAPSEGSRPKTAPRPRPPRQAAR